jgi:hypothetical protein
LYLLGSRHTYTTNRILYGTAIARDSLFLANLRPICLDLRSFLGERMRSSNPPPGRREDGGSIFDEGAWPLVYVRYPSNGLNDDGIEVFIERILSYLGRRQAFACLIDCRGMTMAHTANQRRRIAEWLAEPELQRLSPHAIAIAVLFRSGLIRGALTAVNWIKPPPAPVKPFGSVADSAPWLRERFSEESIHVTPLMEDLLASRQ